MSCTAAGAGAAATPAAAGASLARRRFLHSRAAHSNHAHRAQSSADSRYFQQQAATSCAAAHLQGRPAPWQQKQHGQQQHHRPSVAAAAAAAGSAGQPDAAGSSSGSWFTKVVLPTALVLLVCNMDRICLSVAILPMAQEYGWPATVQGLIQSAFLWGYTATQLLGGSLADKYGGRAVIAFGVAWFSLASLLLPAALSEPVRAAGLALPAVLLARMCVGLGEGVALPSMSNLVANHVPPSAKARALGMSFTGFHTGNLVGLILSPLILLQFGWRALFYTFGLLGIPLLALWLATAPKPPPKPSPPAAAAAAGGAPEGPARTAAAGSGVQGGEGGKTAASGGGVSVGRLLSHPATWAIIIVNTVNHWGYFIYLNWMPSYFVKALGFDLRSSSFLSLVPWLVMAAGSSAAGFLADSLIARGYSTTFVRKLLQSVSMLVPAAALLFLANPSIPPLAAVAAMTTALGVTSLGQAGFVANMSDIAPQQAGQMFGLCNTFGCLSGIAGVLAVGFIVEATASFTPVFLITAGLYVFAVIAWNLLCTGERVF